MPHLVSMSRKRMMERMIEQEETDANEKEEMEKRKSRSSKRGKEIRRWRCLQSRRDDGGGSSTRPTWPVSNGAHCSRAPPLPSRRRSGAHWPLARRPTCRIACQCSDQTAYHSPLLAHTPLPPSRRQTSCPTRGARPHSRSLAPPPSKHPCSDPVPANSSNASNAHTPPHSLLPFHSPLLLPLLYPPLPRLLHPPPPLPPLPPLC